MNDLHRTHSTAAAPEHPRDNLRESVTAAISLSGVVKDFGATRALDRLDLTVRYRFCSGCEPRKPMARWNRSWRPR